MKILYKIFNLFNRKYCPNCGTHQSHESLSYLGNCEIYKCKCEEWWFTGNYIDDYYL